MTEPPVPYYGAKGMLAPRIVALLPDHRHFVEVFAGSLAVLLAKPPSTRETINDLDGELVTFWRMLRDRHDDLARVCLATPHSRAQFTQDMTPVRPDECAPGRRGMHGTSCTTDRTCARWRELETARRVWSRLVQGRAHLMAKTGWRYDVTTFQSQTGGAKTVARDLERFYGRLAPAAARIRHVQVENMPALDLIRRYGEARDVLLYCDPPYLAETRAGTGYRHEMPTLDEHEEFLHAVTSCRAAVVISGYRHTLYDHMLAGWYVEEFPTSTTQGGQGKATCEVLWSNRPMGARVQGSLFDDPATIDAQEAFRTGRIGQSPGGELVLDPPDDPYAGDLPLAGNPYPVA